MLSHTHRMLDKLSPRGCAFLLVALVAVSSALGYVWFAGSAVVVDETGGVTSAVITNTDGVEQPLHQLWSGYFYAIPKVEGTVEVRCRDGSRKQWGYVTGHMHTKLRVGGQTPCARVIEDH